MAAHGVEWPLSTGQLVALVMNGDQAQQRKLRTLSGVRWRATGVPAFAAPFLPERSSATASMANLPTSSVHLSAKLSRWPRIHHARSSKTAVVQGCEQRYPYPRRECGPCLSSPVRLRPCSEGSPSASQNKTVLGRAAAPRLAIHDTFRSSGHSPHHHTHTGAVLLTSRILRRRAVSVRSFSVVHSLIPGVLASPSAPAVALPPATSTQRLPHTIAATRPRCTQKPSVRVYCMQLDFGPAICVLTTVSR